MLTSLGHPTLSCVVCVCGGVGGGGFKEGAVSGAGARFLTFQLGDESATQSLMGAFSEATAPCPLLHAHRTAGASPLSS